MILKKPYGFFIKHFKLINFILLAPILYISLSLSKISSFYTGYVNANYYTSEFGLPGRYVTLWLLITLVLIILINIFIYSLMKNKNKPKEFYTFSIVYFMIAFVLSLLFYNNLTAVEVGTSAASTSKFFKDISVFTPIPGYIILVGTLFKTIGFNIKTLKFDKTIDLQATEEDEEEIEIGGNREGGNYKRIAIHSIRELKYYIIENKFIMVCIAILFLMVILSNVYINFEVYNKRYSINENFALNNLILAIEDSYITNTDQGGNYLGKNKYYLAVKIRIENNSSYPVTVEKNNFRLIIGNKDYYPIYDKSSRFLDIGRKYTGDTIPLKIVKPTDAPVYSCEKGYRLRNKYCIKGKEPSKQPEITHNYTCPKSYELKGDSCELNNNNNKYVIVYELDKNEIRDSYEMKILSKIVSVRGELNPSYKLIKFKPNNLLKDEDLGTANIKDEITLKDSFLDKTSVTINNITIANNYVYKTKVCETKDNCYERDGALTAEYGNRLVIIDSKINYDEDVSYYKNSKHLFYEDFGLLEFYINDQKITTNLKEVTPSGVTDVKIYQVSSLIDRRDDLKLILKNRNKYITINIE